VSYIMNFPGYVPRFDPSKDCSVSIHAWRCPDCGNLNGISVLCSIPMTEPLTVSCEECPFRGTYTRKPAQ
jgi:hypothetical protein